MRTWSSLVVVLLFSRLAYAQSSGDYHQPFTAPPEDTVPMRTLILDPGQFWAHAGMQLGLSRDAVGDNLLLPLGVSFGVLPDLEAGVATGWLLRPFAGATFLSSARVYARYHLVPGVVALEGALYPRGGPFGGTTQFELLAPAQYRVGALTLYGFGVLDYGVGSYITASGLNAAETHATHSFLLGVTASATYDVADKIFVGVDTGLEVGSLDVGQADRINNVVIPLGFGGGYWLTEAVGLKLIFTFADIAAEAADGSYAGLDTRTLQVMAVQLF